ncbi:uncharacterized protein LOC133729183 isoform X6 [Rosa rugosa]|uniref:uncharacterized protein LOC133729183 isoform X6 n=1 Tax=Rosa rugosa TaxID=74645 RepID=UPI002B401AD5|nr:uncharacterized protein LOC133729183 isoform X6 [Rosa rugosa]
MINGCSWIELQPLTSRNGCSWIELQPLTSRKHQLATIWLERKDSLAGLQFIYIEAAKPPSMIMCYLVTATLSSLLITPQSEVDGLWYGVKNIE